MHFCQLSRQVILGTRGDCALQCVAGCRDLVVEGISLSIPLDNEISNPLKAKQIKDMRASQLSFWALEEGERGVGNRDLLDQPLTAFFASRQCSSTAIRAAMDWAVEQARTKNPVISGFHSPLEQSVLEVLLAARAPCVMVIARKLEAARLPLAWIRVVEGGTAAVIGIEAGTPRLTAELAARRNDWIASRCSRIAVAAISPAGGLMGQVERWSEAGRLVDYLGSGLPAR